MQIHRFSECELDISLLGRFSLRLGDTVIDAEALPGRKAPKLLKLLALQRNHQIVRDRVLDRLWPDLSVSKGASQLYKCIYHIRRTLANCSPEEPQASWIDITEEMVRLGPSGGVSTDVERFERSARAGLKSADLRQLQRAASLYTGDLLPMDLYEEWTTVSRDHLRQQYLDVLLGLADAYRLSGDVQGTAETYRVALKKDALLEEAHRGLMRIYALQDQRERALRQYRQCKDVLARDLEIEPAASTQRLVEEIRSGKFAVRSSLLGYDLSTPAASLPLVSRQVECRRIEKLLSYVEASEAALLQLEGPTGIGKSRLVEEISHRARERDFDVLTGYGREMEGEKAYRPFVELLATGLRQRPEGMELIPGEIAEDIPQVTSAGSKVPHTDRRAAQHYLFSRLLEFIRQRSLRRPLVLILEDMHAADAGSLSLLRYIATKGTGLPLLLVVVYRNDRPREARRLRTCCGKTSMRLERLELTRLDAEEHRRFLRELSHPEPVASALANRIYALSEGNPLFARELYLDWSQHLPDEEQDGSPHLSLGNDPLLEAVPVSLNDLVLHRLDRLSEDARELLGIMAVMGRMISYALLREVWRNYQNDRSSEAELDLLQRIDEVLEGRLVQERGLDYRFSHALFRTAVYGSITRARQRVFHFLVARSLRELHGEGQSLPVEHLAFHYHRAGDARQAAHYLMLAAERAEAVYAHEDALDRYREAANLLESTRDGAHSSMRSRLYERMGDVYRAVGYLERSLETYRNAIELLNAVPVSHIEHAELWRKLALSAIYATAMDEADHYLGQAEKAVVNHSRSSARVLVVRALYHWHLNQLEEAVDRAHQALEIAESLQAEEETIQACEMLAMAYLPMGRWKEGLHYEMRRQVDGWSPDIVVATDAHLCLWEYHVRGDRPLDNAETFIREVSSEAERQGDLRCVAVCHYALGTMHAWRGNRDVALKELADSIELNNRIGSPAGIAYTLARKASLLTVEGALEAGMSTVREGLEKAEQAAVRDHCLQRLYGVGLWNRIEANDGDAAGLLARESTDLLHKRAPCGWCSLELMPWLALYHLSQSRVEEATKYVDRLAHLAEVTGNPVGDALTSVLRSGIAVRQGQHEQSRELYEKAVDRLEMSAVHGTTSTLTRFFEHMSEMVELPLS